MVIPRFERGDNVPIDFIIEDKDGNATEPDNINGDPAVLVEITDSDSGVVVDSGSPREVTSTQFVFDWQTTEGYEEGEYEVEVRATVAGRTELNRDKVVLEDIVD